MRIKSQKRLAAKVLNCSPKRVVFDSESLSDIKEAITKVDIRSLIKRKVIKRLNKKGISKVRSKKRKIQRRKGRQSGSGKRKGKKTARLSDKRRWINRIRIQRKVLKRLRNTNKITKQTYRNLYLKIKGGFFRSKRHIQLHLEEHKLIEK